LLEGDEGTAVSKLALVLKVLKDGEWHGIEELQHLVELNEYQMQEVGAFLYEYDLATMDTQNKKLKINRCFQEFLGQAVSG
jgi:hypothetical protein